MTRMPYNRDMLRSRWVKAVTGILAVILLVGLGFWLAHILTPTTNPLPADITNRINFSPLVITPSSSSPKVDNYKLNTAEDGVLLLSYIIHLDDSRSVTISEYPQPSQFSDVPDFKDKFLENVIQKTTSVSSASGTIVLGKMAKQQNKPMAVMLENGLVTFLVPTTDISENDWRHIGDSLALLKR